MFQTESFSDARNNPSSLVSLWIGLFTLLCCCHFNPAHAAEHLAEARRHLVRVIEEDVRSTSYYLNKEVLNPRVMKAMGKVPRHEFVPVAERSWAYLNRPLPIGHGQTISQPYIVAVMTDLLKVTSKSKVLEVGTGSGYQAAILSELVDKVFTIEIIKPLGEQTGKRLARLGYDNVQVRIGDGYNGWAEEAPFDAIVVTAAASHVPPPLIRQLEVGGIMVIPVGSPFMTQELLLVRKEAEGRTTIRQILPVMFVPLTGEH